MVTVESFTTGERIEVYIFAKPTSTRPAETSCDRVEGDHGCSFASEIDGKPYCRAITQQGGPEDRLYYSSSITALHSLHFSLNFI